MPSPCFTWSVGLTAKIVHRRCSVITSSFHMPRSRAIFEDCFAVAGLTLHGSAEYYSLDFHAVHDEGVFPIDVLAARQQREQESLEVSNLFPNGLVTLKLQS